MAGDTIQQQTTRERENSKLRDLQMQEGSETYVWNINEQVQDPTQHNGAKPKVVRDIVLTYITQHPEVTFIRRTPPKEPTG